MAIISIDSLHTLGAYETNNTQIQQDLLYRERTLEQVRARVYDSGDIMSDYTVIESDPHTQERLRNKFHSIHNEPPHYRRHAFSLCLHTKGSHFSISLRNWNVTGRGSIPFSHYVRRGRRD